MLRFGRCADKVGHGFCLSEVHFSGKEGSLGKFAGLCHAAAVAREEGQKLCDDVGGTVAGDFGAVFAGVRMGGGEECE